MTATVTITTPNDRDVVMTRVFDAPRHLVFDAFTKPELLKQWYGQEGWTLVVCDIDLRVGGGWRFVSRQPNGKTVGQYGVYREVVPGERLVYSERWQDWDPGETMVTVALVEHQGRTTFTETIHFPSKDVRDTVMKSGITEASASAMFARLADALASTSRS
jgi:uncharacterized protein YndB with AHSA1/START domain